MSPFPGSGVGVGAGDLILEHARKLTAAQPAATGGDGSHGNRLTGALAAVAVSVVEVLEMPVVPGGRETTLWAMPCTSVS